MAIRTKTKHFVSQTKFPMFTTRHSLLGRVQDPADHQAWQEFYDLYCPLIFLYCRHRGLTRSDSEEIVSQCLESLSQALPEFEYRSDRGRFKSYLKTVVNHKISNWLRRRRETPLSDSHMQRIALELPAHDGDDLWEKAWKSEVIDCCIRKVRAEVREDQFQIFQLGVVESWPAGKIAELLHVPLEEVYRTKYDVLQKMRTLLKGYLAD